MRALRSLPAILALTLSLPAAQAPKAPEPQGPPLLQRVAILGASLSAGFGLQAEVGAEVGLADVVESSLLVPHGPPARQANLLLFANPGQFGRQAVETVKTKDPTLVVAIDFLFWFGYGSLANEAERLEMLGQGLALLEGFECPILVGDFPDVSDAAQAPANGAKVMLSPKQVPAPETLAKLNERLAAWAAGRENVVIVPVAELLAKLRADEEVSVRGNRWFKGAMQFLVQQDRLHPTLEGTIALWLAGLDRLVRAREDLPAAAFDWSAKSIHLKVYRSKEKERQAAFEKGRKKLPKPILPPDPPPDRRVKERRDRDDRGEDG